MIHFDRLFPTSISPTEIEIMNELDEVWMKRGFVYFSMEL